MAIRPYHRYPIPEFNHVKQNIVAAYSALVEYGQPDFTDPRFEWTYNYPLYGECAMLRFNVFDFSYPLNRKQVTHLMVPEGDPNTIYKVIKDTLIKSKNDYEEWLKRKSLKGKTKFIRLKNLNAYNKKLERILNNE